MHVFQLYMSHIYRYIQEYNKGGIRSFCYISTILEIIYIKEGQTKTGGKSDHPSDQ